MATKAAAFPFFRINDQRVPYTKDLPANSYHKFCKNVTSQNGEDGLLECLLKDLNILKPNAFNELETNPELEDVPTTCEFGASDGITCSNTYQLIQKYGFRSIQIENDYSRFETLKNRFANNPLVRTYHSLVDEQNLPIFFKQNNYPKNFDVLSIDVDSTDYDIWKGLTEYEPKIVIIEANSYRDPVCNEYNGTRTSDYEQSEDPLMYWCPQRIGVGSSFMALIELGLSKNYVPVAFTGNITFVHRNYISQITSFPVIDSKDPSDYINLFTNLVLWEDNQWYTNSGMIFNVAVGKYFQSKFFQTSKVIDNYQWIAHVMNHFGEEIWKHEP